MKMTNDVKAQKKKMHKRKKEFIKIIKENYTVYDSYFLILITKQYIKDLFEYHNEGLNVFCANPEHVQILNQLECAYNIVLQIEKLEEDNDYTSDDYNQLIQKLFKIIASHIFEWWD